MPLSFLSKRATVRSLAGLTAAALGSVALTGLGTRFAPPAFASSTVNGPISAAEILSRAQSWVNEAVPYNQGAFKTDANGTYREDCSGFVSMAWHLDQSLIVTTGGPYFTTADGKGNPLYDTPTGSVGDLTGLQPGDAVAYPGQHIFLFAGWTNKATGDFTYYAESNPSHPTHGPTSANIHSSTIEGWPTSGYVGLRYKNLAASAPNAPGAPAAATSSGVLYGTTTFTASAPGATSVTYSVDGTAVGTSTAGPNFSLTWDSTQVADGNHTVTAVASNGSAASAASAGTGFQVSNGYHPTPLIEPNGGVDIFTHAANGHLVSTFKAPGDPQWHTYDLSTDPNVNSPQFTGTPATLIEPNGGVDVLTNANGHLVSTFKAPNDPQWHTYDLTTDPNVNSPQFTGTPATLIEPNGGVDVLTRTTNGHLVSTFKAPGDPQWHTYDLTTDPNVNSPQFTGTPATLIEPNGGVDVLTNANGHLVSTFKAPGDPQWHTYDLTTDPNVNSPQM
ncbi:Ig-like domain-containing protein [Kitasatospora sp. NPDC092948]|uniref:Ig-like domain-containing protein n=1 Tax=Kitasatospora sp. NPDC092948 TaxID=3364088 RepID=UPI0038306812